MIIKGIYQITIFIILLCSNINAFSQDILKFHIVAVYTKVKDSFSITPYSKEWKQEVINGDKWIEINFLKKETIWHGLAKNSVDTFSIMNLETDSSQIMEGLKVLSYKYQDYYGKSQSSTLVKNINNDKGNSYFLFSTSNYLITKFDLLKIW